MRLAPTPIGHHSRNGTVRYAKALPLKYMIAAGSTAKDQSDQVICQR